MVELYAEGRASARPRFASLDEFPGRAEARPSDLCHFERSRLPRCSKAKAGEISYCLAAGCDSCNSLTS